jgi:pentose-5-phosphate-3-epimerase
MVKVYASLTQVPEPEVGALLERLVAASIDGANFNITDNTNGYDPGKVNSIRGYLRMKRGRDAAQPLLHLHAEDLLTAVNAYKKVEAACLTLPYDAFQGDNALLIEYLDYIRREEPRRQAGLSFNSHEVHQGIDPKLLIFADYAMVVCAQPGNDATPITPDVYRAVQQVAAWVQPIRDRFRTAFPIFAQGKVSEKNAGKLRYAGANALIAGKALIESEDYSFFINSVRNANHVPRR